MDLYCQKCGEPWDVYHVSNDMDCEIEPDLDGDKKPSDAFRAGVGCPCCKWGKDAPEKISPKCEAMSVMMEIMGDDIDGCASMMDDFEFMGMLDE